MAFLTIAGTTVEVSTKSTGERAPIYIGDKARAFDGTLRNTYRATKRQWTFQTPRIPAATATAIRTSIANGTIVAVSGDAMGGVSVNCVVTISGSPYQRLVVGTPYRVLVLDLEEV